MAVMDEINEMSDEIYKVLRAGIIAVDMTVPPIAKMLRKMYLSLIEEGFTEEQALQIVTNWNANMTGGK
jgi:hypothetical protein